MQRLTRLVAFSQTLILVSLTFRCLSVNCMLDWAAVLLIFVNCLIEEIEDLIESR